MLQRLPDVVGAGSLGDVLSERLREAALADPFDQGDQPIFVERVGIVDPAFNLVLRVLA